MEGTWFVPDQEPDDSEKKAEKKDKKDAASVMRKASLLELFSGQQPEKAQTPEEDEPDEAEQAEVVAADTGETQEAELETLSADEQLATSEVLVDERLEAVEAELNDPSLSPEAQAAAIAAVSYLESVAERLDEGEPLSEALVAETAATVTQSLEADLPEVPAALEDDEQPPTPPLTVPPIGGSGGSAPPPPAQPAGVPRFPSYPAGGMPPVTPQPNFNVTPQSVRTTPETTERHSHAKYVLVGGIVGYLIGRRRGRIKTEKQLLPIQQKLETNVNELRQQLFTQEQKVRSFAAQHREQAALLSATEARQHVQAERQKRSEQLRKLVETEPKAPEQIGKFTLRLQEREPVSQVKDMTDRGLFELAQKIPYRGTSVAELYRQGRLDVATVREIAEAFLAGKSYEQLTVKALQSEGYQGVGTAPAPVIQNQDPMSRLADLLPEHLAHRVNNDRWPADKKEPHIMARVGIVAAFTTLVVVVAVIVTLWMFNSL